MKKIYSPHQSGFFNKLFSHQRLFRIATLGGGEGWSVLGGCRGGAGTVCQGGSAATRRSRYSQNGS